MKKIIVKKSEKKVNKRGLYWEDGLCRSRVVYGPDPVIAQVLIRDEEAIILLKTIMTITGKSYSKILEQCIENYMLDQPSEKLIQENITK